MTLICHLRHAVCRLRPLQGGVIRTRVRRATPTVAVIDQYGASYRAVFHNGRHFEPFTAVHLGLLAETRRQSLPR